MYCHRCGSLLKEETVCPACGANQPKVTVRQNRPAWTNLLVQPKFFGSFLVLLLALLILGSVLLWRKTHLPNPLPTAKKFYAALENRDRDALVSLLLPEDREKGVTFCLNLLLQPNVTIVFNDLGYKLQEQNESAAKIRITGQIEQTVDSQKREISFNDTINLKSQGRNWFIEYSSLNSLSLCGP